MPATVLFCMFMRAFLARLAGEGRTNFFSHTRGLLSPAPIDRFAPRPEPYTLSESMLQCVPGLARRLPLNTIFMRFGGLKGHIYTLRVYGWRVEFVHSAVPVFGSAPFCCAVMACRQGSGRSSMLCAFGNTRRAPKLCTPGGVWCSDLHW
jgi:hypothetical protein